MSFLNNLFGKKQSDPLEKARSLLPKWRQAIAQDDAAKYEIARQLYLELVGKCPGMLSAYNNLAVLDIFGGNLTRAQEYAKKATQYAYASGNGTLGAIFVRQGRFAESIEAFQRGGESKDTLTNLAGSYVQLGKCDEAISTAEKALKLDPKNPQAYAILIKAYAANGLNKKAIEIVQVATQYVPQQSIKLDLRLGRDSMLVVAYPEDNMLVHIDMGDDVFTMSIA